MPAIDPAEVDTRAIVQTMDYGNRVGMCGFTLAAATLIACGGTSAPADGSETTGDPPPTTSSTAGSTESTSTAGATESTSTTADPESTTTAGDTDADDPLLVCHQLPAAATAMWQVGEEVESTAQSTGERIAAAGARTWPLALELLRVTDAAQHPSLASAPTSLALVLGMAHLRFPGSQCADSIHATIGWDEDGDDLHQTLGASSTTLESRARPEGEDGSDPVIIGLRPSTWEIGAGGAPTVSETQLLFGGAMNTVTNDGEDGLAAINDVMNCVIEQQSHGLLTDFLPESLPTADTTAFDLNVAYLSAPWTSALVEDDPLAFVRDGGAEVELPAMFGTVENGSYYTDASLTAVDLPLRGGDLVMQLVVPQPDAFTSLTAFVEAVTPEQLELARSSGQQGTIEITMPKFHIDSSSIDYHEPLGLDCELFTLRALVHGATVAVDEKGIEAAAASVGEDWETGTGPGETIATVVIDHPFLFFVYDRETSHVLFSGRYAG